MEMLTLFELPEPTPRQSRRKPVNIKINEVNHEIAKERYYLHRRLKGVFPIDAAKRTIDVAPYRSFKAIPVGARYYVGRLIKLGYHIQIPLHE